jgi:DNA-binding MarR family transcriptional regulator
MKMATMTENKNISSSLPDITEEDLRQSLEVLFFAYRDFLIDSDAILNRYRFGRAHHRVIYFVGRYPLINVGQLLAILRITKQSLARVLKRLIETGVIVQRTCSTDHRQRLLELTEKGKDLEQKLWESQRTRIVKGYKNQEKESIHHYRTILMAMINDKDRDRIVDYATNPNHPLRLLRHQKTNSLG